MSGFNGQGGFLFRETVAGAAQFTGVAGAGDVSFAGSGGGLDYGTQVIPSEVPRILAIGYDAAGAAHTVSICLVRAAGAVAGGERIRLGGSPILSDGTLGLTNQATILCGDGLPVPLIDGGPPNSFYRLQVITAGKTGNATLTVWYQFTPAMLRR